MAWFQWERSFPQSAIAVLVVVLSLGFVAAALIALAVLMPIVIILAVIAGVCSTPFRLLSRRRQSDHRQQEQD